jgi:phosphate transport system permease protein
MKMERVSLLRRLRNQVFLAGSLLSALFGLAWLAAILWTLVGNGIHGINANLFLLATPPPPGEGGGLANAMVGSLIMIVIAVVVGTPIGIMAGSYLAEYGRYSRFALVVRLLNDILLSAPSIVVGLFIYELLVVPLGHFSGIAGAMALAVIVIPVVVRTTENMLMQIPDSQREAAVALGAPMAFVIRDVLWKAARAGILTGVLLAIARISGETAPLLFTALNNTFWSTDLSQPMSSLPVVIFQFALSPYEGWHGLAWAGALVVTFTVLVLSVVARMLASEQKT